MQIRNAFKEFFCALIQEKNAYVARVILGNLRTTTTTGSKLQCTAQARLVNFVVVVSSTTSNKTALKFRWTATSFSREGREGVKWELGLALFWTGKMGFTHWDWDLATGNGMNNYKKGMGFLFFSGLCSNILK